MNEFFAQLQEQLSRVWASLNASQRILFVLAPTVLLIALMISVYIASRPDYVALVSMTDTQRLGDITNYLDLNDIDYQVKGNTILVARRQRDQVRLDLAGAELLGPTVGPGFELFDTTRLGMTDRIFEAQYVRALQNELATTIRIGAGFDNVNVHVTIPKEALFRVDQALPSASVKVSTTRRISQEQVIGIQNLVAGAVPKLMPEHVKVFDRDNRPLAGVAEEEDVGAALAHKQNEVRRREEDLLYAKLAPLIEAVVGPEGYVLTVVLELDWTEKSRRKRTLDPESQAAISEKTYEETSSSPAIAGEPGVGANVADIGIGAAGAEGLKTEITEGITNYEYSITEDQIKYPIGTVVATHITVQLDQRKDPETDEWAPYPQEVMDSLKAAIIGATGIEPAGNPGKDTISVDSVAFDRSEVEAQKTRYWLDQGQRIIRSVLPIIGLAIIGILAYLFFQKAFVAKPIEEEEVEEVPIEPVTEPRELSLAQLGLAEFGDITSLPAEEQRRLRMQEHVISYAQEKPDEVAAIIKAWLGG